MKSIEQFEQEVAAKRERLLKDLALAKILPAPVMEWTGEGGFEKDGNTRKPPIRKSLALRPYLIHSPFRGAEHVAYRVADQSEGGEYPHQYGGNDMATPFRHLYLRTVLDAYQPFMIDTVAIEGRYKSLVPSSYDYAKNRDYSDAIERARGLYEVTADKAVGEHHYGRTVLQFHVFIEAMTVKVSMEIPGSYKLQPVPRQMTEYHGEIWKVCSWEVPKNSAVLVYQRGSGDFKNKNRTLEYLYSERASLAMDLPELAAVQS